MSLNRNLETHRHRSPSRLLLIWLGGFLVIGLIASFAFYSLVRELVHTWNTTALDPPHSIIPNKPAPNATPIPIPDWQGVERVSILLLGIDEREQEQGPWRTDTMIVLTVDPATKTASMLSIPRDLWIPIPIYNTEGKINTAHFLGDVNDYPGGGPALAQATIQYNLGIPTQYYIRLDFSSFEKLVDLIGGIDIQVPETIDDPDYPDSGFGFEPLHIDAGWQHMDGRLALKYARTRNSFGGDFARGQRQRQVIMAVRDKVTKADMLPTLVGRAGELIDTLGQSVRTDLSIDQLIQLAKLGTQIDPKNIQSLAIDQHMVLYLTTPTDPPQDVLVPIRDEIRKVRDKFLGVGPVVVNAVTITDTAQIRVENGTLIEGLAGKTAERLKALGFNVKDFTSADRFDYTASQIIVYTNKAQVAAQLAQTLGLSATSIVTATPSGDGLDIRVILGGDYKLPATPTP